MLRHPLPLLTREVPPIQLDRSGTVLLLQDLHAAAADPDNGWLARRAHAKVLDREFDEYFDTLRLIAPNIGRLTATCRQLQIPVVFSCIGKIANEANAAFQNATGWTWDLAGPDGGFDDRWKPESDEPVFTKPGWGALANSAFKEYLVGRGTHSAIIAGAFLDFGIRQTAYELADLGIGCLVISDAVAGVTTAGEGQTIGNLAHGMTKVRSTAELLDLIAELDQRESVIV